MYNWQTGVCVELYLNMSNLVESTADKLECMDCTGIYRIYQNPLGTTTSK